MERDPGTTDQDTPARGDIRGQVHGNVPGNTILNGLVEPEQYAPQRTTHHPITVYDIMKKYVNKRMGVVKRKPKRFFLLAPFSK